MIKGLRKVSLFEVSESPSRGYWKQFLLLYPGVKCPPLNPHVCFLFYVLIKGLRRAWSFEVSESPSIGYWKQYLLFHPYEHSQNLHAAEGDTLPQGKLSPPPPASQTSCMLSFSCNGKGIENSLVIWSSESPSRGYWKQFLLSRLYEHSQNLPAVEWDTLPRHKVFPSPPSTPCMCSPQPRLQYHTQQPRAKGDKLAQTTVSHPTTELRGTL